MASLRSLICRRLGSRNFTSASLGVLLATYLVEVSCGPASVTLLAPCLELLLASVWVYLTTTPFTLSVTLLLAMARHTPVPVPLTHHSPNRPAIIGEVGFNFDSSLLAVTQP